MKGEEKMKQSLEEGNPHGRFVYGVLDKNKIYFVRANGPQASKYES